MGSVSLIPPTFSEATTATLDIVGVGQALSARGGGLEANTADVAADLRALLRRGAEVIRQGPQPAGDPTAPARYLSGATRIAVEAANNTNTIAGGQVIEALRSQPAFARLLIEQLDAAQPSQVPRSRLDCNQVNTEPNSICQLFDATTIVPIILGDNSKAVAALGNFEQRFVDNLTRNADALRAEVAQSASNGNAGKNAALLQRYQQLEEVSSIVSRGAQSGNIDVEPLNKAVEQLTETMELRGIIVDPVGTPTPLPSQPPRNNPTTAPPASNNTAGNNNAGNNNTNAGTAATPSTANSGASSSSPSSNLNIGAIVGLAILGLLVAILLVIGIWQAVKPSPKPIDATMQSLPQQQRVRSQQ